MAQGFAALASGSGPFPENASPPRPRRQPQSLPPLLVKETAPQEVNLLVDAAWQEWDDEHKVVDALPAP
jgi:hypothetical protein